MGIRKKQWKKERFSGNFVVIRFLPYSLEEVYSFITNEEKKKLSKMEKKKTNVNKQTKRFIFLYIKIILSMYINFEQRLLTLFRVYESK